MSRHADLYAFWILILFLAFFLDDCLQWNNRLVEKSGCCRNLTAGEVSVSVIHTVDYEPFIKSQPTHFRTLFGHVALQKSRQRHLCSQPGGVARRAWSEWCPTPGVGVPVERCSLPNPQTLVTVNHSTRYPSTSLIRNSAPLGPYSRTKPRALWWF